MSEHYPEQKNTVTLTALWFDKGNSDESWVNAFEAYGHAMAAAAALELLLALYIIKKRALDIRQGIAEPMSKVDMAAFAEATRKKTLPKLISGLKRSFNLPPEIYDALNIAKAGRDYLAHDFWQTNIGFIQSPEGVELIVQQCSIDAWHFKELASHLETVIGFSVDDYTEQVRKSASSQHQELSDLLAKYL